jgi:GNAT superfamily N-acetyltransferase
MAGMPSDASPDPVFLAWIHGWAVTRQVDPPTPHADGFRIEVGLPRHAARYVFRHPSPALRELGATLTRPWVFLKAAADSDALRALLPTRWQLQPEGTMMTCGEAPFAGTGAVAPGYALHVQDDGARTRRAHVEVRAPDGSPAAAGHLALEHHFAVYDRIVTEPAHQRRGLGGAVMHALQALARRHGRHAGVLVATPPGRALYASLGWRVHAPWATAVIPGPEAAGAASAQQGDADRHREQ